MLKKTTSLLMVLAIALTVGSIGVCADEPEEITEMTETSLLVIPLTEEGYLLDMLSLPTYYSSGVNINWRSSDRRIINPDTGAVCRPVLQNENVTLYADWAYGNLKGTKEFNFVVPAYSTVTTGAPIVKKLAFEDDFEDGARDTTGYISYSTSSTERITEENGKTTCKGNVSNNDYIMFRVKPGDVLREGTVYTEYILSKDTDGAITFKLEGQGAGGSTNLAILNWKSPEKDSEIFYKDGASSDYESSGQGGARLVKIAALLDATDGKYDLYINNKLIFKDHAFLNTSSGVRNFRIECKGVQPYPSMENYRVYHVADEMTDADRVEADKAALLFDKFMTGRYVYTDTIDKPLNLPVAGSNGSDISWETTDASVCDEKGEIYRAEGEKFKTVTLTASIKSGEVTDTVSYTFNVADKDFLYDEFPYVKGDMHLFESFESTAPETANIEGKYTISGGKLNVTKGDMAYLYLNSEKNGVSGIIGVDFDITKGFGGTSATETCNLYFMSSNGGVAYNTAWNWRGVLYTEHRDSFGNPAYPQHISCTVGAVATSFKTIIDTNKNLFWVWANGILAHSGCITRSDIVDLSSVRFVANATGVSIDNLRIYDAGFPTEFEPALDAEAITSLSIVKGDVEEGNVIKNDLDFNLPNGSKTTFSSSNPTALDPVTGKVTRGTEDITVTLTTGKIYKSLYSAEPVSVTVTVKAIEAVQFAVEAPGDGVAIIKSADGGNHEAANYYLAAYSENRLAGIKTGFLPAGADGARVSFSEGELPEGTYTFKLFIWNNVFVPFCAVADIK